MLLLVSHERPENIIIVVIVCTRPRRGDPGRTNLAVAVAERVAALVTIAIATRVQP
jgi:hypothetical protein